MPVAEFPREWSKVDERGLARFVTPDAVTLLRLPVNRLDLAAEPEGRRRLVEAIYGALLAKQIRYAAEMYHPSDALQPIRRPADVLEAPREGTCLDLAVLFCGLCLGNELLPVLVVTEGHAFAAVSLTHGLRDWNALDRHERELFQAGPMTDPGPLRELVDGGAYITVECTGFAQSKVLPVGVPEAAGRTDPGVLSFERAAAAGREQLDCPERPFRFALDIAVCHYQWRIGPPVAAAEERYSPVKPALREVFAPLLDDRTALFAGREDIQARVEEFAAGPAGGYLMITAPAGFGKTALMANIVKRNPEAFAYHFFTPLYGTGSLGEEFFLRNVVQQMAQWHAHTYPIPEKVHELRALYHKLLDEYLDCMRVLVIDGLDEVTTWQLRPYLSRHLPARLHLILTVRDVGQDWSAIYGMPPHQTEHLPLGGLTTADVSAVLRAAGTSAAAVADDSAALDEVVRISSYQGDPTLGCDPFYMRLLAEDLADGRLTAANLAAQPQGLANYLDQWWEEIKQLAGDAPARDLFGTLTACFGPMFRSDLEAVNPSLVNDWGQDFFEDILQRVRRFVVGNDTHGYALAHPRLRQYMRKCIKTEVYRDRLLAYCADWKRNRSSYPLSHYAEHLKAAGQLDKLYSLVLDPQFRAAQREILGRPENTLGDLRLALHVALEQDHTVKALACAGAYRETAPRASLTEDLLKCVDRGDFTEALAWARLLCHSGAWEGVVFSYLAWEAALAGKLEEAVTAATATCAIQPSHTLPLCETLLTRAARILAPTADAPSVWIGAFSRGPEAGKLVECCKEAPLDARKRQELIATLDERINSLRMQVLQGLLPDTGYGDDSLVDEQRTGRLDMDFGPLRKLTGDSADRGQIEDALDIAERNPYPRYRDIAFLAISLAVLAVPDPAWARQRLRRILRAAMQGEGVTFTFDLAAVLLAECGRRNREAPVLAAYLGKARAACDRWGTRMRERSARAAALFRQGKKAEAFCAIGEAEALASGYSGYISMAYMALANRCIEIGNPEGRVELLADLALKRASNVRDPKFREDRVRLVKACRGWLARDVPSLKLVLDEFAAMSDREMRIAFLDSTSARWSWPPENSDWEGLKALLPLALLDGSSLDAVLARITGLRVTALTDDELNEAVTVCGTHLVSGRPWELRQGAEESPPRT